MWHMKGKSGIRSLRVLAILAAAGVGAGPTHLAAEPGDVTDMDDCRAGLRPEEVRPAEEPVTVIARLSEDLGRVNEVEIEERSRVEILRVQPISHPVLRLTLDTSEAARGEWEVTFTAEAGACAGRLRVAAGH